MDNTLKLKSQIWDYKPNQDQNLQIPERHEIDVYSYKLISTAGVYFYLWKTDKF